MLGMALTACNGGTLPTPSIPATTTATQAPPPTVTPAPATIAPTATVALPATSVDVAGTHVTMTPPDGFVASTSFVGFEHECGASIVVSELPTAYADLVAQMTDEGFAAQGITDVQRHDETVDGRPATFIVAKQEAAGISFIKILVVTGTKAVTAFLTGNFPFITCPVEIGERMRDAELGMSLDPDRPIDAQGALRFTIVPAPPLKFAGVLNNGALYNVSGTLPAADPGEPSLIVAPSLGGSASGDLIAFATAQLRGMTSIHDVAVESSEVAAIAGRPAAIIIATGKSTTRGVDVVIYQVLLGGEGDYVALLGICDPDDRAAFIDVFAESIKTYAPKP